MKRLVESGNSANAHNLAFAKSLSGTVLLWVKLIAADAHYENIELTPRHVSNLASFIAWRLMTLVVRGNAVSADGTLYSDLMSRMTTLADVIYPRSPEVVESAQRLVSALKPPGGDRPDSFKVAIAYVGAIDRALGADESFDVIRHTGMFGKLVASERTMGRLLNDLMGANRPETK